MSDTDTMAPVYLPPPLEDGTRVATAVGPPENLPVLLGDYGPRCDVVLLAVPMGEGVIVEHWLRKALGIS